MSIAPTRKRQLAFFQFPRSNTAHGGALGAGRRKTARPICTKRSIHVVMRASAARGRLSLLHPSHAKRVFLLLHRYANRFEVKVYEYSNVGNHLHLLVKAKTREGLRNFLRAFTGHIAQLVTGSGPRRPLRRRFWDLLAFTRIIEWGRGFKIAKNYLWKNIQQAASIRRVSPLTL